MSMTFTRARQIFGISGDEIFSPAQLKAKYREKAKTTHPDMGGSSEAFRELTEAYELLSGNIQHSAFNDKQEQPKAKSKIWPEVNDPEPEPEDDGWRPGDPPPGFDDWTGMGGTASGYKANSKRREFFWITVTPEEAYRGTTKPYKLRNGSTVNIQIPRNARHGQTIYVDGGITYEARVRISNGNATREGGFTTDSNGDIYQELEVSGLKLIIGGRQQVKLIDGTLGSITIPAGCQSGSLIRISGRGYWKTNRYEERGDCYFRVKADVKPLHEYPQAELAELSTALQSAMMGGQRRW